MRLLPIVLILIASSFVSAKPTTAPSTQPATQRTSKKFPTPAELIAKMKAQEAEQDAKSQVAYFDLSQPITERPADFSLFGSGEELTLHNLLKRLAQAKDDAEIEAVLVTLGGVEVGLAQAQEIREALGAISRSGKPVYVYADSFDTSTYVLASGADHLCMLEGGTILMPGIGIETMFLKGLFDKLGVQADYVQIGEFKGAQEPFTRTEPTEELKGELNKLSDSLFAQIIDGISDWRKIDKETVREAVDLALISGKKAEELGLVDHLLDIDSLRKLIEDELENEVDVVAGYGEEEGPDVDFSSPFSLLALFAKKTEVSENPSVALIYAAGTIVDGEGGDGIFGDASVGSEALRRAFRIALRDEKIKAVVIRIDSPGGSALASEVMWQSARHVAAEKPVIISIGGMAASGGYYLASAGETIFADSSAIVGSIGVVGGKFVMKDLYEKLGVTTQSFVRGANADLFSASQPFTERQRAMVTTWMTDTYEQFTERVMTTRKGKIKDIDQVARGRIFVAADALKLGLVDEIGTTSDALAFAAGRAKLKAGEYDIRVLPSPRTLADLITGHDPDATFPFQPSVKIAEDSILHTLPASTRRMLGAQVRMLQMLQDRPVILASPMVITVK